MASEAKLERRRRDLIRMKGKAKRFAQITHSPEHCWSKLYNHLAYCSKLCCGNPRKHFGERTMQERRFEAAACD